MTLGPAITVTFERPFKRSFKDPVAKISRRAGESWLSPHFDLSGGREEVGSNNHDDDEFHIFQDRCLLAAPIKRADLVNWARRI